MGGLDFDYTVFQPKRNLKPRNGATAEDAFKEKALPEYWSHTFASYSQNVKHSDFTFDVFSIDLSV